jgi:hypothetical protein
VEGSIDTDFYIRNHSRFQFLPASIRNTLPEVLENTLYVFSLQEGNLELMVRAVLWTPLKRIGATINAMNPWLQLLNGVGGFVLILLVFEGAGVNSKYLAIPIAVVMVLASLSAFSQKHSPFSVWNAIAFSSILAGVAVWLLNPAAWFDVVIFGSGIIPAWILGIVVLAKLLKNDNFADSPFAYRLSRDGGNSTKTFIATVFEFLRFGRISDFTGFPRRRFIAFPRQQPRSMVCGTYHHCLRH